MAIAVVAEQPAPQGPVLQSGSMDPFTVHFSEGPRDGVRAWIFEVQDEGVVRAPSVFATFDEERWSGSGWLFSTFVWLVDGVRVYEATNDHQLPDPEGARLPAHRSFGARYGPSGVPGRGFLDIPVSEGGRVELRHSWTLQVDEPGVSAVTVSYRDLRSGVDLDQNVCASAGCWWGVPVLSAVALTAAVCAGWHVRKSRSEQPAAPVPGASAGALDERAPAAASARGG